MRTKKVAYNQLIHLLEDQYIENDGAENLDIAIRDLLTDILHVIKLKKLKTHLPTRVLDAIEVFNQEIEEDCDIS
jgi:hypothetical protein